MMIISCFVCSTAGDCPSDGLGCGHNQVNLANARASGGGGGGGYGGQGGGFNAGGGYGGQGGMHHPYTNCQRHRSYI